MFTVKYPLNAEMGKKGGRKKGKKASERASETGEGRLTCQILFLRLQGRPTYRDNNGERLAR